MNAVESDNKNPNTPIAGSGARSRRGRAHASRDAPPAGRPPARATRRRRSDQTPIAYAACVTLSAVSDVLLVPARVCGLCHDMCLSVAAQVPSTALGLGARVPRHAERGNVRVAGGHAAGRHDPPGPAPGSCGAVRARAARSYHGAVSARATPFMRTSDIYADV